MKKEKIINKVDEILEKVFPFIPITAVIIIISFVLNCSICNMLGIEAILIYSLIALCLWVVFSILYVVVLFVLLIIH